MKKIIFTLFILSSKIVLSQTISTDSLKRLFDVATYNCVEVDGDSIKGIEQASKYLLFDSASSSMYNSRGVAFYRCHQYEKAFVDYKKSVHLNKTNYNPVFNMGLTYYDMDNYKKAITYFDSTLVLNPAHVKSYYFKANASNRLGDSQSAIKYFSKSLEIDNNYFLSYKDRGLLYSELHKYDLAIKDFDKAISIHPNDYVLHAAKGMDLMRLSQPDKGIMELLKAKKMSDDPMIDMQLGVAYAMKKETANACLYLKKAVDKKFKGAKEMYEEYCK